MILRSKIDFNTENKLSAMCTPTLHNREIIKLFSEEININKMFRNTKIFAWQKQLLK